MALKLEKIAKLETLSAVAVICQFIADISMGRDFQKIQFIAISCLFLVYFIMGLEAFCKDKLIKSKRKASVHIDPNLSILAKSGLGQNAITTS